MTKVQVTAKPDHIRSLAKAKPLDALAELIWKQMGTSVVMIERHYSHLKVIQAAEQLRGAETRRLIEADTKVSDSYKGKRRAERDRETAL